METDDRLTPEDFHAFADLSVYTADECEILFEDNVKVSYKELSRLIDKLESKDDYRNIERLMKKYKDVIDRHTDSYVVKPWPADMKNPHTDWYNEEEIKQYLKRAAKLFPKTYAALHIDSISIDNSDETGDDLPDSSLSFLDDITCDMPPSFPCKAYYVHEDNNISKLLAGWTVIMITDKRFILHRGRLGADEVDKKVKGFLKAIKEAKSELPGNPL